MIVLINAEIAKLMVIDNLTFCVLKAEINCVFKSHFKGSLGLLSLNRFSCFF